MSEATESVNAERTSATSLVTREMRVPVGWRGKKARERD